MILVFSSGSIFSMSLWVSLCRCMAKLFGDSTAGVRFALVVVVLLPHDGIRKDLCKQRSVRV